MGTGLQGSSRARTRLLCSIAAVLVTSYIVFLAWWSPAGFPQQRNYHGHMPYLADKLIGEDAYYMLVVADNIATQGKIAYNRGEETTGIQPLATFVFAGVDWGVHRLGGTEWDLLRWILVLEAGLLVLFAAQLAAITGALAPAPWADAASALAFLLVLTDYTLFRLFTYGLETGLYLCLIALCFRVVERIGARGRTGAREAVWLGLAAGMAGLARIDFGILFAVLLGTLLFRRWISPVWALASGALALLLVSPWFLFLHRVTGAWMPTSGKAESAWIADATASVRLKTLLLAVASQVAPWSYGLSPRTAAEALVSMALVVALFFSAAGRRARAEAPQLFRLAAVWLPGLALLTLIYLLFFFSVWFYDRYTSPLVVVTVPVLAMLLASFEPVRRQLIPCAVLLFCPFTVWTIGALHTGHLGNSHTVEAGYVRTYYPTAHLGAFQSGVIGYFNRNVENLDGKLNLGALKALEQHRMPAFLDSEGVTVLVDWPSMLAKQLPPGYLASEWVPCPVPIPGADSVCLIRKGVARP